MEKSSLPNKALFVLGMLTATLFSTAVHASDYSADGASYLRPAAGASAQAMGGAFSASPDYLASWYNPSSLALLRQRRIALGGGYRSMGRTESLASFEFMVPPRLGLGISALYRGDPFISGLYDGYYDDQGVVIEEQALDRAAFTTFTFKIGAGYRFSRSLLLGGSIGIFYQSLPAIPLGNGAIQNESVTSMGGFDFIATYIVNENLTLSGGVRNLGARFNWQIQSHDWHRRIVDIFIHPSFVLSSSLNTSFMDRELIWNTDLVSYLFDGEFKRLSLPEAVLNTGVQWRYWDNIYLMAGIGDLQFNSEIYRNTSEYFTHLSPRISAGFSWKMDQVRDGLQLNYALATDRIWAGLDQQIDFTLSF
ncbi:hypothetical protein CHISP_2334 [Chitinispirillum alkaliphilum]|nr:hypothetical protein CHISP_2334 [Chitinispirillum alkaliphilum]